MSKRNPWDVNLMCYKDYIEERGTTQIDLEILYHGVMLGVWVYTQYYKQDTLEEAQLEKLSEIGFSFQWEDLLPDDTNKFIRNWFDNFKLLLDYLEENKHTLLTCTEEYKGVFLGSWLYRQRIAAVNGDLSAGRELLLLNFGVFLGNWEEQGWDYKYFYAQRYFQKNKNLKVPAGYQTGGFNLYSWIEFQKKKQMAGRLESDKVKKLEAIGIKWSQSYSDKWEAKYLLAKKYKEEYGSLDVERNKVYEGVNLDAWLNNQRRAKRGEKHRNITEKQIKLLDDLGMKW